MSRTPDRTFQAAAREALLAEVGAAPARRSRPEARTQALRTGLGVLIAGALVAAVWTGIAMVQHGAAPVPARTDATARPVPVRPSPTTGPAGSVISPGGPLDAAGALAEYRRAIPGIPEPLPAGRAYPARLPAGVQAEGGDGMIQGGRGQSQAWYTWLCAWEGEYLAADAAGDAQRRAAAEREIERWPTMAFYRSVVVDPGQRWTGDVVDTMRRGDPSGVRQDHAGVCAAYPTTAAR